jgi:anti-sigma factor RsiW
MASSAIPGDDGREPFEDHQSYEKLAVEHVLGGLTPAVSSRFRDHLMGCQDCRRRVVELRGIASDLEAAAREELAAVGTKPATERREIQTTPPGPGASILTLLRRLALILLAATVTIMGFWNIHLRTVNSAMQLSLAARGEVLDVLATGEVVALTTVAEGFDVQVVATPTVVALNARGLQTLRAGELVVLWGIDERGIHRALAFVGADGVPGGRLVMSASYASSIRVEVTIETGPLGITPVGLQLLSGPLPEAPQPPS